MIVKDGLIIRALELSDLATLLAWNTEEGRGEFLEVQFKSLETLTERFHQDGFLSELEKMLLMETTKGDPVGLIYILFKRPGLVNLGMGLCKLSLRDQGLGTKAASLIVDHLFSNYPLARIEAETDHENIPAQKVLEKIGFVREGVLRNYRFHHGAWRDFAMYSILPGELKK